jgi:replicative DNA helicase
MMPTYDDRLEVEQRLLAALTAWPRPVELEPRHFIVPAHQVLFGALQELGEALLEYPLDHRTLKLIRDVVARDEQLHLFNHLGGVESYVDRLIELPVVASDIPDLVAIVRTCARCGR